MSRKLLYGVAAPVLAAVVAIAVSSIALLIAGESPRTAFLEMWKSIDSTASVVAIVNRAVPYYVAGVAVAIGFIMRLFNIGVDGQHQLAALFAAAFGFGIGSWGLPAPIYVLSIFLVAVLVAMAWAAIAAVLKVTRNVNEVISTIMLNFIASQLIFYLLREHWNRGTGLVAETGPLPSGARIPHLNRLFEAIGFHFPANVVLQGFLPIAILVGIGYYVVLNRSRFGFDLRVSGQNPSAAKASGINPKRMVLLTFLISGGVAGLIGLAPLLADPQYGKYGDQFPQGLGFTGLVAGAARPQPPGRHRRRRPRLGDDRAGDAAAQLHRHPPGDRHHPAGLVPARRRRRLRGRPPQGRGGRDAGRWPGEHPCRLRRRRHRSRHLTPRGRSHDGGDRQRLERHRVAGIPRSLARSGCGARWRRCWRCRSPARSPTTTT